MTKPMNCQTAHEQLQQLLDNRCDGSLPADLQDHLAECQACQNWQALFHMQPTGISPNLELPADFGKQILARYTREQRRIRWIRTSSLLAIAASLLVAGFVWISLPQPPHQVRPVTGYELAQEESLKLYENAKQRWGELQARVSELPAPSFSLPSTFTEWDMQDVNDPLAVSMPALRTVGITLQGAIEPYQVPARETMKRVKALIEEPEVKKWVDNVKKRVM
ncbi:MAG: hypothetical protein QM703_21455 [Gemmatales bacterium]